MARNILSWPCICCIFSKYFTLPISLWNTRASPASLSAPLPSSRNRRTATKKSQFCWYSNVHIEMQSILEISLGTWLVPLGDYPPIPHSLFHRPNGRTEMWRFPEKNKFPGWFRTSLWKSKVPEMCMVPDFLLPSLSQASGWQIFPSTHGQGAVSHLVGLWCCRSPKHKARCCWARLLSCCCLSHAGMLKGITWDHLSGLIATQRSRSAVLFIFAGIWQE